MNIDYSTETLVESGAATITADDTDVNAQAFSDGGHKLSIVANVEGKLRIEVGYGEAPPDPSAIAEVDDSGAVMVLATDQELIIVAPQGYVITHAKFRGTGTTSLTYSLYRQGTFYVFGATLIDAGGIASEEAFGVATVEVEAP